jgi:formyl-CoA transferase
MSITGEPDGPPVKSGVPLCDLVCGLYAALAVVTALRTRERDGTGELIDVSLFESGVSLGIWEAGRYFATGEVPRALGSAHQSAAPYQALRASDGWFTVGATSPPNWRAFCDVLGHPEWEKDERFATASHRLSNRSALIDAIEAVTATEPIEHWVRRLQGAGVPCAAIQTYDEVFHDPHLLERGFFWDAMDPRLGAVRQLGSPMHFTHTSVRRDSAGPALGADSAAILAELGCTSAEVASLAARGVTRLA